MKINIHQLRKIIAETAEEMLEPANAAQSLAQENCEGLQKAWGAFLEEVNKLDRNMARSGFPDWLKDLGLVSLESAWLNQAEGVGLDLGTIQEICKAG